MKKVKKILWATMAAFLLVIPSLSGNMSASANYYDEEEISIAEGVLLVGAAVGLIEKLFCPKTPQNVCKGGICKTGACISLRTPCGELGTKCGS
jgi:hypothetical protein